MKKTLFKKFTLAIVALAATMGMSSCVDPNKSADVMFPGLDVTAVTPTFNAVTFTVNAEPAVAIAYICVPQGTTMLAKDIFEKGTATGTVKGVFTIKSLTAGTKYTLLVAKRNQTVEGPSSVNFETPENGGTPPTPQSAGIRVEEVTKDNVKIEIINGAEADYSYVSIWPEVFLENAIMEAIKDGKTTREKYLQDLAVSAPYMCATTVGRGKTAQYDYVNNFNSESKTSKLWPAGDYLIVAVAMQGDFDKDGKDGKPCGVTDFKFRTDSHELLGKPSMIIDTLFTDYIRIRYTFRPSADVACYAVYATKKSEIDEFIKYYDEDRGAGQGVAMLREFVRFADEDATEKVARMDYSLNLGFDQGGIDFEMMSVPMDRNTMPGELTRRVDQVRPTPTNQVDAVYEFNMDPEDKGVGATNFWYGIKFGKNCGNIYWRITTQAEYDAAIASLGARNYARDLWSQGWGEDRPANPGQSLEHSEGSYRWGIDPNKEQIIVATSLNYTGGLSMPKVVAKFTTKAIVYDGTYAPQMKIVADGGAGKTSAKFRFFVPEKQDRNIPRILRNIILEDGDPFLKLTDAQFSVMLLNGYETEDENGDTIKIVGGNEWSVYSIDDDDKASPYDWRWEWTGMKPGTKYIYTWLTEDRDGRFSALDRINFTTANNNGGPNPAIAITIDPKSIKDSEIELKKWGADVQFTPNDDVTSYSLCVTDQQVIESYEFAITPKAELERGLKEVLVMSNMGGFIDATKIDAYSLAEGYIGYAVALTYGAAEKEGKLTYLEFKRDGTIGSLIEAESRVSQSQAAAMRRMAPLRGLEELKARDARARVGSADVQVLPPFASGEPQAYEEMTPDVREVKVRSMNEISQSALDNWKRAK